MVPSAYTLLSACLQHPFLFRCGCFLGASHLLLGCVSIAFRFQCTAASVCIPFGYPNLSLSAAEWPLALRLLSESLLSLAGFVPSFLVCPYMHLPDVRLSPSRSILAAFRVLLGCLPVGPRLISGVNPIARRLSSDCVTLFCLLVFTSRQCILANALPSPSSCLRIAFRMLCGHLSLASRVVIQ